jgi:hypothetical protein
LRGAEPAVIVVTVTGAAVVRRVCQDCLMAHDGRRGWPLYADVIGRFARSIRV